MRRPGSKVFATVGIVAVALVVLAGCWPQPGAGPDRGAYNPLPGNLDATNVAGLDVAWSRAFGEAPMHDPVVWGGEVHVVTGGTVHTVSLWTGATRWSTTLIPPGLPIPAILGGPSFADGKVFVPESVYRDFVPGSGTHALDLATGSDTGVVANPNSNAVILKGSKLVGGGGKIGGTGLGLTYVSVTDLVDGARSWSGVVAVGSLPLPTPTIAAVGRDRFVVGVGSTVQAYSLSPPSCSEPTPGVVQCVPLWSVVVGAEAKPPVLSPDGTTAYVGTVAGALYALDTSNGATRWSATLASGVSAAAAVGYGAVYVPTADGRLYAFTAGGCGAPTCTASWHGATGRRIGVQPAVAGDVVYTGSDDGALRAFGAHGCATSPCAPVWSASAGNAIAGAPAVAFGRLLVGTLDGRLIAFSPGGA